MITEHTDPKHVENFNDFDNRQAEGTVNLTESPFFPFSTTIVRLFEREGDLHLRGKYTLSELESVDVVLTIAAVEGPSSGDLVSGAVPYAWYSHNNGTGSSAYYAVSGSFTVQFDKANQHLEGNVEFISRNSSGREYAFKFNFNVSGFDTKKLA